MTNDPAGNPADPSVTEQLANMARQAERVRSNATSLLNQSITQLDSPETTVDLVQLADALVMHLALMSQRLRSVSA